MQFNKGDVIAFHRSSTSGVNWSFGHISSVTPSGQLLIDRLSTETTGTYWTGSQSGGAIKPISPMVIPVGDQIRFRPKKNLNTSGDSDCGWYTFNKSVYCVEPYNLEKVYNSVSYE
jgi:hypothetical protein